MGVAEDSRKVERIVQGSYDRFEELYRPSFGAAENDWGVLQRDGDYFTLDTSPAAKAPLLASLPACLLSRVAASVGRTVPTHILATSPTMRAALASDLAGYSRCDRVLRSCLAATVRRSSARQVVVGVLSAGGVKAVRYAWRKVRKGGLLGGSAGGGADESSINRILSKAGGV